MVMPVQVRVVSTLTLEQYRTTLHPLQLVTLGAGIQSATERSVLPAHPKQLSQVSHMCSVLLERQSKSVTKNRGVSGFYPHRAANRPYRES